MNIGEMAKATGVSAKMIRYYESIELIPAPARSESGYRVYNKRDVATLRFIRRGRALGFSMKAIRQLLALWQDNGRSSSDVKAFALMHVDQLNSKIEELQEVVATLQYLVDHCPGDEGPECPILYDLAEGTDETEIEKTCNHSQRTSAKLASAF